MFLGATADADCTEQLVDPEFIDCLFGNVDGLVEVREIGKEKGFERRMFFRNPDELKSYVPPADKHVYFGVFTRRNRTNGRSNNCVTTSVLWSDYDGLTLQQVKSNVATAGLPEASILVSSGHGIHAYWLLDRRVGPEVVPVVKELIRRTGGDPKVKDISRTMRLPGSWNVKDEPVLCEVQESNGEVYSFETIATVLRVHIQKEPSALTVTDTQPKQRIPELHDHRYDCLRKIADGVPEGHRNFAIGRIVGHLKLAGTSYQRTLEIIKLWNQNNRPAKQERELVSEVFTFWNRDYRFTGAQFTDERLQEINEQYCHAGCLHSKSSISVVDGENAMVLDNDLFRRTVYPRVGALELACLSFLIRERELTRERLSQLVNRHNKNQNFIDAIKALKSKGLIEITPAVPRKGIPEKITYKEKSNYGRGYTLIPALLTKLFTKKGLSDEAYKLSVLLKHFAYGKEETFPTIETMADRLGVEERSVTRLLKRLDDEGLIKREYKKLDAGKTRLITTLLF